MKKPVVSAKAVLNDIRLGLDDDALMTKYGLSSRGLRRTFAKLSDLGLLKHIDARELVKDLRAGTKEEDVKSKYGLNDHTYQSLMDAAKRAGLLNATHPSGDNHWKTIVRVSEIVHDIQSGATEAELKEKYRLSSRGLRWISTVLVSSGAIGWQDVFGKLCSRFDELALDTPRRKTRHPIPFDLPVHESGRPEQVGRLRDVTENGIGITGIKAKIGEMKTLVIGGDEFGEFGSFTFDAVCRWLSRDSSGKYFAGFEISEISMGNLAEFKVLLRLATFSKS